MFTPAGMMRAVAVGDEDVDAPVRAERVALTEELDVTTVTTIVTV